MTKEEIQKLEEKFKVIEKFHPSRLKGELKYDSDLITVNTAARAMDEYAKQEAIAFNQWCIENYDYDEVEKSFGKYWEIDEVNSGFKAFTHEELYNLFIQHQSTDKTVKI